MKKILALLLILIIGVSTAFASGNTLFASDYTLPEKFLNLTNIKSNFVVFCFNL